MEKLNEIKEFECLRPITTDEVVKNSLRLLCVFGANGSEVIFVTKDDKVYGFGPNRYGCLGLSTWNEDITDPTLNETLSGKKLSNIYYGFGHCIALTVNGKCFCWGCNDRGQIGISITGKDSIPTPQPLFGSISRQKIVTVCCGPRYNLALTYDGKVWGWGDNRCGQLGIQPEVTDKAWVAVLIPLRGLGAFISCGQSHSLVVTRTGMVYLWGYNDCGQLGYRSHGKRQISHIPLAAKVSNIPLKVNKAVCGHKHTLLLARNGNVYVCGLNNNGQVGDGRSTTQVFPKLIRKETKFKDIFANYDNNISIGVSMEDKYFVWGLAVDGDKHFSIPQELSPEENDFSVFDIYVKYTKVLKTFRTIDITAFEDNILWLDQSLREVIEPTVPQKSETKELPDKEDIKQILYSLLDSISIDKEFH